MIIVKINSLEQHLKAILDSAIHWIDNHPLDNSIEIDTQLDSALSTGWIT